MVPVSIWLRRTPGLRASLAIALLAGLSLPTLAQAPPAGNDTVPLRAAHRDLNDLVRHLPVVSPPALDEARALWLGTLPLACLDRLQPQPTARGSSGAGYFWTATYTLVPDHDRLRAFWGCDDWHSAVASTWVTVRVLEAFPRGPLHELAREKLNAHLGRANLEGELAFFRATAEAINPIPSANQRGLFERPYGFAWLLELYSTLRAWPDSQAKRWSANMAPLAAWMADSLGGYMEKLVEPVRSGTPANTAESMILALDYSASVGDTKLRRAVISAARKLYLADTACATQSEYVRVATGRSGHADASTLQPVIPAGAVQPVLSPCLTEAALMGGGRVLDARDFALWLDRFLPPLQSEAFAPLTTPIENPVAPPMFTGRGGAPTDTSVAGREAALAAERARLAGLSFARAQAMERIARALPAADPRVTVFHRLAAIQADRGFTLMEQDNAAGVSWVPAQALLYLREAHR